MDRNIKSYVYATELLRRTRSEWGLKQEEMADMLAHLLDRSISKPTYEKWEAGGQGVTIQEAAQISKHLNRKFSELWATKDK